MKKYIAEEIENIEKNILLIDKKIDNDDLSPLGVSIAVSIKQTLQEVEEVFKNKESDVLLVENIYSQLPKLYLAIGDIN